MTTCPKGKILRKGYIKKTKTGSKKIKANCIKSTSASGLKRSSIDKKIMKQKSKTHSQIREKYGTPKCKKGEIIREGYKRKTGSKKTVVKPVCIKKTGKKGSKGKQLFRMEKGTLGQFGYENVKNLTVSQRHTALSRAVKNMNPLSVFRKLKAIRLVNGNKDPALAEIFNKDASWVKTTDEYQHRSTV